MLTMLLLAPQETHQQTGTELFLLLFILLLQHQFALQPLSLTPLRHMTQAQYPLQSLEIKESSWHK